MYSIFYFKNFTELKVNELRFLQCVFATVGIIKYYKN